MDEQVTITAASSVADVIAARLAGHRDDGLVLGLAVDGGGMRGVISGAMLMGLKDIDVLRVFDRFYGTSSGALNLAQTLTGGSWPALSMYYEQLTEGFVRRSIRPGRPTLNMAHVRRLIERDILMGSAVFSDPTVDFRILVTDVESKTLRIVQASQELERLTDYLMAGAWLPYVAGKLPTVDGRVFCDGYVLEPNTFRAAARDGCTHVLSLTPMVPVVGGRGRLSRSALSVALDAIEPGLGRAYLKSRSVAALDTHDMPIGKESRWLDSRVLWLAPARDTTGLRAFTTKRDKLLDGVIAGYETTFDRDWAHVAGPVETGSR
jgi:predicted acylesterase/phospholipase RssA